MRHTNLKVRIVWGSGRATPLHYNHYLKGLPNGAFRQADLKFVHLLRAPGGIKLYTFYQLMAAPL